MLIRVIDRDLYGAELEEGVFRPKYAGDAGIDLRSTVDVRVHAGETVRIPLGLAVSIPVGHVGLVSGRSSTALEFGMFTHEGKIDSGYRGEINTLVTALGSPVDITRGERISQLIIVQILTPDWTDLGGWDIVDDPELWFEDTERGEAGLGSTGRQ